MQSGVVKVHRYLGLLLAFFLIIIAGTGSIIAFYDDFENSFNADMRIVEPQAKGWTLHDALVIRELLVAASPKTGPVTLFPGYASDRCDDRKALSD